VTITMDGAVLAGEHEPSSEWRVHVAVYAARQDARVLVHTHSEHATAWSERGERLGEWLTAPFAPSGSDEIARTAVAALGDRSAVLLGGHGVLALGDTPAAALAVCVEVERAARDSVTHRTQARP
jgi:L-fuculose-phosphate aldolase